MTLKWLVSIALLFTLLFLLTYVTSVSSAKARGKNKRCNVSVKEADRCAKSLMFEGDRNRFVPRNESQMNTFCRNLQGNVKCLENHSKCYESFPRQVWSLGLRRMKSKYHFLCKTDEGRKTFLHHTKCIVSPKVSEPSHQCVDKWTVMMNNMLNSTREIKEHFRPACCAFHIFMDCLYSEMAIACKNTTGVETAAYVRDQVRESVKDFMDLACNEVRTVDQCEKNYSRGTAKLKALIADGVPPQNSSALLPFLRLAIDFQ